MWHRESCVGLNLKIYAFSYKGFPFMKMIICEGQGEKKEEKK
jgi:hypothetical protein